MKLTKSIIATTFAALLIGGLSISSTLAAVNQTGRVDTGTHAGFEMKGDSSYVNPRSAPEGSQPILKSSAEGKTNGRQG
jgi:hypothetical protein